MVFVVIWFLDHFTLEPIPSMNVVWIVAFVNHLHAWVTKFKPWLIFFQLPVLTSNNVIWVNFSAILFDETQHAVKTSMAGYVPACYEIINLFIKPQNFLLILLTSKLKGLSLIVTVYDGLLMFFLYFVFKLLQNMRKQHIEAVSSECFCLWPLTSKNQFIHTFLNDVIAVFPRVLRPIHEVCFKNELCQLPLMSLIFSTAKVSLQHQRPWWSCHILVPCTLPWHVSKIFH